MRHFPLVHNNLPSCVFVATFQPVIGSGQWSLLEPCYTAPFEFHHLVHKSGNCLGLSSVCAHMRVHVHVCMYVYT